MSNSFFRAQLREQQTEYHRVPSKVEANLKRLHSYRNTKFSVLYCLQYNLALLTHSWNGTVYVSAYLNLYSDATYVSSSAGIQVPVRGFSLPFRTGLAPSRGLDTGCPRGCGNCTGFAWWFLVDMTHRCRRKYILQRKLHVRCATKAAQSKILLEGGGEIFPFYLTVLHFVKREILSFYDLNFPSHIVGEEIRTQRKLFLDVVSNLERRR